MDSWIIRVISDKELEKRIKSHAKWRQKQLNIFYRTGKPIFNISLDTQHIRSNRDPHNFREKDVWDN